MNVKINVPDDICRQAEAAAREQRISVEEVLESPVEERWQAWDALNTGAVMAKAPNVEPDDHDRL